MHNKSIFSLLLIIGMLAVMSACTGLGMYLGRNLGDTPYEKVASIQDIFGFLLSSDSKKDLDNPDSREVLFKPFWEAWGIVREQYVDQPVNEEALMRGAIRGMLEALDDPHSSYMDPDEFRQLNIHQEGEYEGIGAWVDTSGEYLKIISPMPNSPAEEKGLRTGDTVIAIDGEDMKGIDGNLVLRRILGPAGTKVILTILREGDSAPFDVEIERAKIIVPSVEGKMLENDLAYIRLYTFGDKTTAELHNKLGELLKDSPKGLIIDLRNNGGGYLNTAIEVVSEFIKADQIVMYEEFGDGKTNQFKSKKGGLATEIPLVVLVNKGTASASEITAGAIQDYQRGKIIGEKTFGKGSVQNVIVLSGDEGAIRVTIARWLTPKYRLIHEVGLTPDIEVEISADDIKNDNDPQLERAIRELSKN